MYGFLFSSIFDFLYEVKMNALYGDHYRPSGPSTYQPVTHVGHHEFWRRICLEKYV